MGTGKDTPSAGQRRAMEASGRNLLVSAAAGSGKTYTLVERIVRNIVAGKYRVDELMVVTFTNAAAAEMRERIEKKLMAEVAEHPELARQLVLLPGASISTMHSFCQRLVRENFTAIDVDPKFRIVSNQESALIRQRVIEELFEAQYETQDEDFLRFARFYGSDRNDEKIYKMVLDLYDFAESQANPTAWLSKTAALFSLPDGKTIEDTVWYPEMMRRIRRTLAACADAAAYYAEMAERDALPAYVDAFVSDRALVARLSGASESGNWEEMREAFSVPLTYPDLSQQGAKIDEKMKKYYKDGRDKEIKNPLAEIVKTYFTEDAEELLDDLRATGAEAATICRLAQDFAKAFSEAKRKKALLDFGDLEHYAFAILAQDNVVEALKGRYKEIMVDEYQDTNGVQEAILQRITNGRNLFMVGD
ncbi:MAG: UvrD-helicase domain-containing protein, partial [Schwartzia sp.]|nr:UvrD-helicase domain-containing protein [Schwartzia sp. (in: firmicutes)]